MAALACLRSSKWKWDSQKLFTSSTGRTQKSSLKPSIEGSIFAQSNDSTSSTAEERKSTINSYRSLPLSNMNSEGDTEACASTTSTMRGMGFPGNGGPSSVRKRKFDHDEGGRDAGAADVEAIKLAECIRCGTSGLHPLDFLRDHVLASCTVRCALKCGWMGPACVYKTMHECQPRSDAPHASDIFQIKQLEQLVRSPQSEVVELKEQLSHSSQSSAPSTAATVGSSIICNAETSTEMDTSEHQETSAASAPPQKVSSITSITSITSVNSIAAPPRSGGLFDLLHAAEKETHECLDRCSSPTNANQVSSDRKDTAGARVTHPHRHAVRFTHDEQKIIERAYLVYEAWQCFGDHPRAGDGGESGGGSGHSLSRTRHTWATIARAYFPSRVGEPRFTQSLRNYCRKLVGRICGPRDAEATAEYEQLCFVHSHGVISSSLSSSTKWSSNKSNEHGVSHTATPPPPLPPPAPTVHFPSAFFPTTLPSVPTPSRLTPYLTMMEEIIRSSQTTASGPQ